MLLSVVDLNVDTEKLQEISGVKLDKPTGSPLDILNKYYAEVLENRKLTNRQLDSAKKVLADMPEVAKVEAVSVTELVAEKEKLEKINRDNKLARDSVKVKSDEIAVLTRVANAISAKILELEKQLTTEREKLVSQNKLIKTSQSEHDSLKITSDALQDKHLTEINTKIQTADETNRKAQQYINRTAKQAEMDKYQLESDDYTAKLKKIADYKNEIVNKTKFPVEGLDFANGGVTYNKIPFKQASGSQTLKVSTAIGMALNPRLRVMLIDGAESLDSAQMGIISSMAANQDYQLWLTRVSEDEKVGIYIEDGEIKNLEVAE